MFAFDPHGRLAGVHPDLIKVVQAAALICKQPFQVIEGLRTAARQAQLYAQGRTAPGNIVTWVRVSNHQAKPDGFGHAVDMVAIGADGSIDWNHTAPYDTIDDAMHAAAKSLNIGIRYGGDWDMDGNRHEHGESDIDHWELHP